MININANLLKEPTFGTFTRGDEEVQVVNFALSKGYGKGREYINCAAYGNKSEVAKEFSEGDFIHVYGYFNKRTKNGKTYKNSVVMSMNKIEKKEASLLTIQADMSKPEVSSNHVKLQELMKQQEQVQRELDQLFKSWEELEAKR